MTPDEALKDLTSQGVSVTLNGDKLKIVAPDGLVTDELREWFWEAKPMLVAHLRQQAEANAYGLEERAAVYEFEAGHSRDEAEQLALREWQTIRATA